MKVNYCYHDAPYQIWNSYIISDFIVFLMLALFGFVLLYDLFCDICSDTLTYLFCVLFGFFSNDENYKKNDWLELSILSLPTKNNPTVTEPVVLLRILPFLVSLHYLPSVSPSLLFITSIHPIMWRKRYGRQPVSRHYFLITLPDNDILHFSETMRFSEYQSSPDLQLTSYYVCTH